MVSNLSKCKILQGVEGFSRGCSNDPTGTPAHALRPAKALRVTSTSACKCCTGSTSVYATGQWLLLLCAVSMTSRFSGRTPRRPNGPRWSVGADNGDKANW